MILRGVDDAHEIADSERSNVRAPAIASTCFCAAATILQVMPLLGKDLDLLIPDGEIAKPSEKH
jgi:hypothetical protein